MKSMRFNWKFALVLAIALVALGITAFALRTWQRNRMAYGGLAAGEQAYAEGLWEEAATNLGRYISVLDSHKFLLPYFVLKAGIFF